MNTNRKLTTLFTTLLLLAATAASADKYSSTQQRIREVPNHHYGLEVEIWTDRGDGARYRAGDPIEIFFRTNADAWVAIYDLDTRGQVTKLYPRRRAASNFVRGGVVHRVPSRYGYHFEVEGPSGWETLRAVASTNRHALKNYRWNDRWNDRNRRYDNRDYENRRYDNRDYDGRYRPTTSRIKAVPDRIREVPDYPTRPPEVIVIDETRHYVRDGYYRAPRRPSRPWWNR